MHLQIQFMFVICMLTLPTSIIYKLYRPNMSSDTKQNVEYTQESKRLYQLGQDYQFGLDGQIVDVDKAILNYCRADQLGNINAKVSLAYFYFNGLGLPLNEKYAIELYQIAAKDADNPYAAATAKTMLGFCFSVGKPDTPKNEKYAIELFLQAATHDPIANHYLGDVYEKGLGTEKDIKKAHMYYKIAIAMGYKYTEQFLLKLESLYPELKTLKTNDTAISGKGTSATVSIETAYGTASLGASLATADQHIRQGNKLRTTDLPKSADCFEKALAIKMSVYETQKQTLLGILQNLVVIYTELGLSENANKHQLLQKKINSELMYDLGLACMYNTKQPEKAVAYFQAATNDGHSGAQSKLAYMYQLGVGVTKNPSLALKLCKLAADQGDNNGLYRYGFAHECGLGTSVDMSLALKYYKLAAQKHHGGGCYKMGVFYEQGTLIQQNYHLAAEYYKKAIGYGHPYAKDALAELLTKLDQKKM